MNPWSSPLSCGGKQTAATPSGQPPLRVWSDQASGVSSAAFSSAGAASVLTAVFLAAVFFAAVFLTPISRSSAVLSRTIWGFSASLARESASAQNSSASLASSSESSRYWSRVRSAWAS